MFRPTNRQLYILKDFPFINFKGEEENKQMSWYLFNGKTVDKGFPSVYGTLRDGRSSISPWSSFLYTKEKKSLTITMIYLERSNAVINHILCSTYSVLKYNSNCSVYVTIYKWDMFPNQRWMRCSCHNVSLRQHSPTAMFHYPTLAG